MVNHAVPSAPTATAVGMSRGCGIANSTKRLRVAAVCDSMNAAAPATTNAAKGTAISTRGEQNRPNLHGVDPRTHGRAARRRTSQPTKITPPIINSSTNASPPARLIPLIRDSKLPPLMAVRETSG